ncbi:MAG TPA: peptidylprolyl isomerase [Polyangiales bacterium]
MKRWLSCLLWVGLLCVAALHQGCGPRPQPKSAPAASPAAEAPAPPPPAARAESPSKPDVERIFAIAPSPNAPKIGKADAKVLLQVCSDFECPFCARLVPTLHELVENYGELIRVEWRNCPLPFHSLALPAAEAAVEVFKQGGDAAFWAYHDILFSHQSSLAADKLPELARSIAGVDAEKVKSALADHRHTAEVRKDLGSVIESGAASGGFGTPATFINGRLISGAQPYDVFEQAVERALIETPEALAEAKARSDLVYPMARAKHILIQYKGAQGAEPKVTRTREQARALAELLLGQLMQPKADFAQLARSNSDCPSAPQGGELGRFTRGDLVPQFESALFALRVGEMSGVVETPFGYHIIVREE